ncbi:MAG: YHS domain-containing protein [Gammaproteobacteria bacterium]|nr:MAG: YHS domain-containing protein [Gammaproteobacteria bacterium]
MMKDLSKSCPVCGMAAKKQSLKMDYHQLTYHFCSTQCQETFLQHPELYSGGYPHHHNPVYKNHRITLSNVPKDPAKIRDHLQKMKGIKEVTLKGNSLNVEYDVLQTNLQQIMKNLDSLNCPVKSGLWGRMKTSWTIYTEKNELDNLSRGDAPCCNRPPPKG